MQLQGSLFPVEVAGTLGDLLRQTRHDQKASLADLTVLSSQNDPYRLDTPAHHRNGAWLYDQMTKAGLLTSTAPIHNRGVHYVIVAQGGILRPDGKVYVNDDESWSFIEKASKAARWLGYVGFDRIVDARNSPPVIIENLPPEPRPVVRYSAGDWLPEVWELRPFIGAADFRARQPFKLVFFGEKTSLEAVLRPIAKKYEADLYLPSGEISDTMIERMARNAAIDGRPIVVFTLADCDPAGFQMSVSIGHKLRALKDSFYPALDFRLLPVALTVEQVKDLGLPSTPLKETELRAAGWRARYGVEQTEIDALATLQPKVLADIVIQAIRPWYDASLDGRVEWAKHQWMERAQDAFQQQVGQGQLDALAERAAAELDKLKASLADIQAEVDGLDLDLPPIMVPEPFIGVTPEPLVSSDMALADHIAALRKRKDYSHG